MPFTLSHPVFAIPFKLIKPKYVSLTGLILGSMAPDFEYFIVLEPHETIGHDLNGLFLQAIPLSIIFAYGFHYIIKASLAQHLPGFLRIDLKAQSHIKPWRLDSLWKWIIFIVSIVGGFYIHIFLDAFTHQSGYFAALIPLLQTEQLNKPMYKILQYSLSLIGLAVECMVLLRLVFVAKPAALEIKSISSKQKITYWTLASAVMIIIVILKLIFSSSSNYVGILFVAPFTGLFMGILLASIMFGKFK